MALADKPLPSFFFYSSGAPRDPHSFPTRRSSDLIAVLVGQPRPLAAAHEHRLGKPSGAGCAGTRADASHQVPGGLLEQHRRAPAGHAARQAPKWVQAWAAASPPAASASETSAPSSSASITPAIRASPAPRVS